MNKKVNQKGNRKEQAQLRRRQIIDAALRVFAEKGYDRASVKDISEAAGTSQGLMYHYFRSKEELLAAVLESHSFIGQLSHIIASTHGKPIRRVLYDITTGFYDLLRSNRELTSIVVREMQINTTFKKNWAAIAMKGVTLLSDYLRSNVDAGRLKPHNTEVAARSIFYTVVMLFLSSDIFTWSKPYAGDYIQQIVDIFLDGLAVRS